jgi:hypothetical protein
VPTTLPATTARVQPTPPTDKYEEPVIAYLTAGEAAALDQAAHERYERFSASAFNRRARLLALRGLALVADIEQYLDDVEGAVPSEDDVEAQWLLDVVGDFQGGVMMVELLFDLVKCSTFPTPEERQEMMAELIAERAGKEVRDGSH